MSIISVKIFLANNRLETEEAAEDNIKMNVRKEGLQDERYVEVAQVLPGGVC